MVEIKITKKPTPSFINTISYVLIGILLSVSVFSLGTRVLGQWGMILSTILCIFMSYYGIKKSGRKSGLRKVTYGIIGALIFCIASYFTFLIVVHSTIGDMSA